MPESLEYPREVDQVALQAWKRQLDFEKIYSEAVLISFEAWSEQPSFWKRSLRWMASEVRKYPSHSVLIAAALGGVVGRFFPKILK